MHSARITALSIGLLTAGAVTSLDGVVRGDAEQWPQELRVLPGDGFVSDHLGTSVGIDEDTAVVGAPNHDDNGFESGSAYVYRRAGLAWSQDAELLASDGEAGDFFGTSVAVSGHVAIVGAPNDDDRGTDAGAVYVFRRTSGTWNEEAKLLASDGANADLFGRVVAIVGDLVVVGTPRDDDGGAESGAIYVFRYDALGMTWSEETKLTPADGAAGDEFGAAVAIDGDVVVVGAHLDDDNGAESGSAYVFRYDAAGLTWNQETKLVASDGETLDDYGASVTISDDVVLVGSRLDDDRGAFSGSVYVYRYDDGGMTWSEEAKLLASDGTAGDAFGHAVDLCADLAIVGASGAPGGAGVGLAYVYEYREGGWREEARMAAPDPAHLDGFGEAVAISQAGVIVGVPRDDDNGADSGSAYVFRYALVSDTAGDRLAQSVANAGDVDGDGVNDFIAGAPFSDREGANAGKVVVFSGRTLNVLYVKHGREAGDRFGWSVASAGDVDDDGRDDFLVSAPRYDDGRGRVYVFSGADGSRLEAFTGERAKDQFGYGVAGGVDVDHDGRPDVIIGAPRNDDVAANAGKVYVYSGRDGGLLGAIRGEAKGDRFGWSVAGLAPADEDDHGDVVVGAPRNDAGAKDAGKAYLYSGRDLGLVHAIGGRRANDRFGYCVAAVGRVDDDAQPDLAVAAPFYDGSARPDAGRVEVYSGRSGDRIMKRNGQEAGDRFGLCVRSAGDVDGDGRDDLIIGAPRHDAAGANAGRVYVRSGRDGSAILVIDGHAAGDQLGFAVAGLGDVDHDGLADVVIGAPYEDTGAATGGRVYLRRTERGLLLPEGWIDEGEPREDGLTDPARGVAIFGDVDGDGVIDERDLVRLLSAWGAQDASADLDGDGFADVADLRALLEAW